MPVVKRPYCGALHSIISPAGVWLRRTASGSTFNGCRITLARFTIKNRCLLELRAATLSMGPPLKSRKYLNLTAVIFGPVDWARMSLTNFSAVCRAFKKRAATGSSPRQNLFYIALTNTPALCAWNSTVAICTRQYRRLLKSKIRSMRWRMYSWQAWSIWMIATSRRLPTAPKPRADNYPVCCCWPTLSVILKMR